MSGVCLQRSDCLLSDIRMAFSVSAWDNDAVEICRRNHYVIQWPEAAATSQAWWKMAQDWSTGSFNFHKAIHWFAHLHFCLDGYGFHEVPEFSNEKSQRKLIVLLLLMTMRWFLTNLHSFQWTFIPQVMLYRCESLITQRPPHEMASIYCNGGVWKIQLFHFYSAIWSRTIKICFNYW